MRPPCEVVTKYLLPSVRRRVARGLSERGVTQRDIAALLGVSQPVVSDLIRGDSSSSPLDREAARIAEEILSIPLSGEGLFTERAIEVICASCKGLKLSGRLCPPHKSILPILPDVCRACSRTEVGPSAGEFTSAVNDVRDAVSILSSSSRDLLPFYPEVGINVVRVLGGEDGEKEEGGGREDLMVGIPGRVVRYRDRLVAFTEPEVGSGFHNGGVLSAARRARGYLRAIINLRWREELGPALTGLGVSLAEAVRDRDIPIDEREAELLSQVEYLVSRVPPGSRAVALVDPGAFGIEPAIYILASTASEAARVAAAAAESALIRTP